MKQFFFFIATAIAALYADAQKDYKVVFDLTSPDTIAQKNLVRWAGEISKEPGSQVEVVLYGKSLNMVVKDRSVVATQISELAKKNNVSFKVCEQAMKHNNIAKEQLLPGVGTVPDGIYEIIKKQREGFGYIKAAQ
ncbi:MAG: DsrE family protein [Flavisolibacter sp.]